MVQPKLIFRTQFEDQDLFDAPDPDREYKVVEDQVDIGFSVLMKWTIFVRKHPELLPRIQTLCQDPSNLTHRTASGYSPLAWAAMFAGSFGTEEVVELILASHPDLSSEELSGDQGLLARVIANISAGYSTRNTLQLLLKSGKFNPNFDDGRFLPLTVATVKDDIICVELLLTAGADVNAMNEQNPTALMSACIADHSEEMILTLLKRNPDVNLMHPQGVIALNAAVGKSNRTTVELLLKAGAIVDLPMPNGMTPLLVACRKGSSSFCTEMLLKAGANPYHEDNEGHNAFHYASRAIIPLSVEALMNFGHVMHLLQMSEDGMSPTVKSLLRQTRKDRHRLNVPLLTRCLDILYPMETPEQVLARDARAGQINRNVQQLYQRADDNPGVMEFLSNVMEHVIR